MKITIELSELEELRIMNKVTKATLQISEKAIKQYFRQISNSDFVDLLRRALKHSSDVYFQHFMQYYVEQQAPQIFDKIHKDFLKNTKKSRKVKQ